MQHPNPLSAQELARRTGKPASAFTEALAAIDQDALYTAQREQLVAGVWDQTSPVNGVAAEVVLGSLTVPAGGAVVTIAAPSGTVSILQPFDPNTPGLVPIPAERAQDVADAMADGIAAERARAQALAALPDGLADASPDGGGPADPGVDLQPLMDQLSAQADQLKSQQESIDWLADVVITLSTGEDVPA